MARTLSNLIPTLYMAVDTVVRELTGFIPAVSADMTYKQAAIGQTVVSPVSSALTASNITAGVTPPDDGDNATGTVELAISKARRVPVRYTGEQELALSGGVGMQRLIQDEFAQAMRTLVNEIEADIAATYVSASRAHGTAGTTPFGATPKVGDAADVQRILDDNGCPMTDRQLVIDTAAATALAKLTQLTNVNEAGDADLLRRGILGQLFGFDLRKSAQTAQHTAGTGASYLTDLTAGYSAGDATIHVDTGTGTFVAGDVVSFAEDTGSGKYVVKTGFAGDGDGDIVLQNPGLIGSVATNKAVSIAAAYRANLAFHRSAIQLATRAPAVPAAGDLATDRVTVTDPQTGLSFVVSEYRQYKQIQYEVAIAWGVAAVKPEFMAILLG